MKKFFIPLLTLIFIILSCEKENSPTITDVKPGNITGVLDIWNSDDNSGAFVSLKGTNISTTTNSEGRWTLTNVEPGVYDIIFSKPGYDTTECYGFPFPGNGTAYCDFEQFHWANEFFHNFISGWEIYKTNDNIIKNMKFEVKESPDPPNDSILVFSGILNHRESKVFLFFGDKSNITKTNYDILHESPSITYDESNKSFEVIIHKNESMGHYLSNKWSKKTGFVIAYPGLGVSETDLRNGKTRWMGLGNPSNVVEFIVP